MHEIRLRGPWDYEVLEPALGETGEHGPRNPAGKQKLPSDWSEPLGSDFRGRVAYRRRFHAPTGLEEDQEVWLAVTGIRSHGKVELNGTVLGEVERESQVRFPVAALLKTFNLLTIEVTHGIAEAMAGGIVGEVLLEIQTVRPRPSD